MLLESPIVLALLGSALFIGGQLYGQYRISKKAKHYLGMLSQVHGRYREAMAAALKDNHSLNIDKVEEEALEWQRKDVAKQIGPELEEKIHKLAKDLSDRMRAAHEGENNKERDESKRGNGD